MTGYPEVLSPTEIRFERLLPGPIENVWSYLTDSKKRGEWLASGPMELRVGGKVSLRFKHSELSPLQAPPPERFAKMDAEGHTNPMTYMAGNGKQYVVIVSSGVNAYALP